MTRASVALAVLSLGVLTAGSASAYCRTTTCDEDKGECFSDENGCRVGGLPLRWGGRCVVFSVQQDASPRREISLEQATKVISDAYVRWMNADCGGANPQLTVIDLGAVECDTVEFNEERKQNANIWMFRDERWPYADNGHTLALTTVTFNVDDGEIFDADVEINTFQHDITLSARSAESDLPSIVTHEAGHALGLNHSNVTGATMSKTYVQGDQSLRSLSADDEAAICEVFAPDDDQTYCLDSPIHGFSSRCGAAQTDIAGGCACRSSAGSAPFSHGRSTLLLLGAIALGAVARRR